MLYGSSKPIQKHPTTTSWIGLSMMAQATWQCLNFPKFHKRTEISRKNIMTTHLWNHCRNTRPLQIARCQDIWWPEPSTSLVMNRGRADKLLTVTRKRTWPMVFQHEMSQTKNICQLIRRFKRQFRNLSTMISQKSTKKHISRESEHPLVAESLDQAAPGLDD